MARLFFALWPDPDIQQKLAGVARHCGLDARRLTDARNLHITLEFLGEIDSDHHKLLIKAAGNIQADRFSLLIDDSGWWASARVAWLAPGNVPAELLDLYRQIHRLVITLNLPVQERPYRPHITLARKVPEFNSFEFEPIIWNVQDFCLVESNTLPEGAEYRIIQRWPLT